MISNNTLSPMGGGGVLKTGKTPSTPVNCDNLFFGTLSKTCPRFISPECISCSQLFMLNASSSPIEFTGRGGDVYLDMPKCKNAEMAFYLNSGHSNDTSFDSISKFDVDIDCNLSNAFYYSYRDAISFPYTLNAHTGSLNSIFFPNEHIIPFDSVINGTTVEYTILTSNIKSYCSLKSPLPNLENGRSLKLNFPNSTGCDFAFCYAFSNLTNLDTIIINAPKSINNSEIIASPGINMVSVNRITITVYRLKESNVMNTPVGQYANIRIKDLQINILGPDVYYNAILLYSPTVYLEGGSVEINGNPDLLQIIKPGDDRSMSSDLFITSVKFSLSYLTIDVVFLDIICNTRKRYGGEIYLTRCKITNTTSVSLPLKSKVWNVHCMQVDATSIAVLKAIQTAYPQFKYDSV